MARSRMARVFVGVTPLLFVLACGDDTTDPTGTGGAGGAGGAGTTSSVASTGATVTTTSSSSSSTSSTSSTSSNGGGGSTNEGGGGNTSEGGGGNTSEGGGGNTGGGGSGGSNQGGGGGGVGIEISDEDCASAEAITLPIGQTSSFFGDTSDATADDLDTCSNADPAFDGLDIVLAFTLEEEGSVRLTLRDGPGFDGNLVLRTSCEGGPDVFCGLHSTFGDRKRYSAHLAAGTYYAVVDSVGQTSGQFDLDISYREPACGDAIINPGEECDVGLSIVDDGCGDTGDADECLVQTAPEEPDVCNGESFTLEEGVNAFLASDGFSTTGFIDDYIGSCMPGTGGVDRVFAFTPEISGTATVTIGFDENNQTLECALDLFSPRCWDQAIHVRSTCEDESSELACADLTGSDGETLTFTAIEGETVFLFVDGYDDQFYSQGPFNLFVELTP